MKYVFENDPMFKQLFFNYEDRPMKHYPRYGVFCTEGDQIVGAIGVEYQGATIDAVPIYTAHWRFEKGHRQHVLITARMMLNRIPAPYIFIVMMMDKVDKNYRAAKLMALRLGFKAIEEDENCTVLRISKGV